MCRIIAFLMVCISAAALLGGCKPSATQTVNQVDSIFAVKELLANPQSHSHAVVKVRGCVYRGFEVLVLEPCESANRTERIWVDDAENEQEQTRITRLHPEYRLPPGTKLFFPFDEARNKRAWQRLDASFNEDNIAHVSLVGQFESGFGFGHLGAYSHELILVDVLGR